MSRVAVPDIFRVTLVSCVATKFWIAALTELHSPKQRRLQKSYCWGCSSSLVLTSETLIGKTAYLMSLVLLLLMAIATSLLTNSSRIGSSTPVTVMVWA